MFSFVIPDMHQVGILRSVQKKLYKVQIVHTPQYKVDFGYLSTGKLVLSADDTTCLYIKSLGLKKI